MAKIIRACDVKKSYINGKCVTNAVKGVDLEVEEGEFLGIMGPSGSGKSSLLNVLGTIDDVSQGHIFLKNKDITVLDKMQCAELRKNHLSFIFQDFNLLDTLTVKENIILALTLRNEKSKKAEELTCEIMEVLGISEVANMFPYQISGGQKQRCACARAIVGRPDIIFADEPTGSLDSASSDALMHCLRRLNEDFNVTIVLVTHDPFSASYCNRILFMTDGVISYELVCRDSKKNFLYEILDVVSQTRGECANAD